VIVFIAAVAVLMRPTWSAKPAADSRENPYSDLRTRALTAADTSLGLHASDDVWSVVMDLPVTRGTATVVAYDTGDASIYLSSGGGFIGGGLKAGVREAAQAFIATAQAARGAFVPTTAYPPPEPGQVQFYVRIAGRVEVAHVSSSELESGRHPLSALYVAGHGVITACREAGIH
jgi:hypothetical protein